jgi:Uncharacterised nucleotidyltransferase
LRTAPGTESPLAEAARLTSQARDQGLTLGVLGGVGIALLAPSAKIPPLARKYGDLDLAITRKDRPRLESLLAACGYQPDQETNALFGRERLIYFDAGRGLHVDIMLDHLHMCHDIPFHFRDGALTAACLLLTKLQVVQTTEKDLRDIAALLVDVSLADGPGGIDMAWLAGLCSKDWGLWRTVMDVLERVTAFSAAIGPLPGPYSLSAQVDLLAKRLETSSKSLGWKARAAIGRRVQWYDLPEEGHKKA